SRTPGGRRGARRAGRGHARTGGSRVGRSWGSGRTRRGGAVGGWCSPVTPGVCEPTCRVGGRAGYHEGTTAEVFVQRDFSALWSWPGASSPGLLLFAGGVLGLYRPGPRMSL